MKHTTKTITKYTITHYIYIIGENKQFRCTVSNNRCYIQNMLLVLCIIFVRRPSVLYVKHISFGLNLCLRPTL